MMELIDVCFDLKEAYLRQLYPNESQKQIAGRIYQGILRRKEDQWKLQKGSIQRIIFEDTNSPDYGFVILDILFAENEIYKEALEDIMFVNIDGATITVPTRENLVKIKRLSGRPQDMLDIKALQGANEE